MSRIRFTIVLVAVPLLSSCDHTPATAPRAALAETKPGNMPAATVDPTPLVTTLNSEISTVSQKVKACRSIELMGPSAAKATDALIVAMRQDRLLRFYAGLALVAIGPAAVPALRASMNDAPEDVQNSTMEIWAQIDSDAGVSVDALQARSKQGEPLEKAEAQIALRDVLKCSAALGAVKFEHLESATAFVKTFRRGKPAAQVEALNTLAGWGNDGSSLSGLVRPLMESPSADVAQTATYALLTTGEAGIVELIDALDSPDDDARLLAVTTLARPAVELHYGSLSPRIIAGLARLLTDTSPGIAAGAARGLCLYGLETHPILVKAMKDGNEVVRAEVINQLMTRPEDFTQDFVKRTKPTSPPTPQRETEIELARLVAPALLKRATNGQNHIDWRVLTAFRALPPAVVSHEVIALMEHWLADETNATTETIVIVLSELGPTAIPELIEACKDTNASLRVAAITALLQMPESRQNSQAMEIIAERMFDPQFSVRLMALRWVVKLSNPSTKVLQQVADVLIASFDEQHRFNTFLKETDQIDAITMLGRHTSESDSAVKALKLCISDPSNDVRVAAIIALRAYGAKAKPALAALVERVSLGMEPELSEAAETLLSCGRDGRLAVTAYYIRRLQYRERVSATLQAIAIIGPDAASAVPALQGWLTDHDNALRAKVAGTLGQIGPSASASIPALVRMVDNADPEVRHSASNALVKISPDGKGLGAALVAAIYNGDRSAADRLTGALRRSGDNQALVARLTELATNDPEMSVRTTAHRAVELLSIESSGDTTTRPVGG